MCHGWEVLCKDRKDDQWKKRWGWIYVKEKGVGVKETKGIKERKGKKFERKGKKRRKEKKESASYSKNNRQRRVVGLLHLIGQTLQLFFLSSSSAQTFLSFFISQPNHTSSFMGKVDSGFHALNYCLCSPQHLYSCWTLSIEAIVKLRSWRI
jgi:hypothetical protein